MDDTAKYLIHARIAADGVVERSDVVGAVFGQTEGLLGEELDLRDLQQSSKVGRIDVDVSSENGQSFGKLTIATSLDKAETAVLGASLETIERVGPCRASIEVTSIEDVRAAKRRAIVDRAKELLATAFDETAVSSADLLADVRESIEVEEITDYAGLPAGPSVGSSDAIIVVEGRADVLQLLKYGIKNAIAVEGTNVPEAVASLTADKTVTAFVDGDRGGELILRELMQVGDVDYVVFAPAGRSVEDLSRDDVHSLLREKIAVDRLGDAQNIRETIAGLLETGGEPPTTEPPANDSTANGSSADSATEVEV
ncbi:MAG: DNA primase DnaG, partial [Halohasta sp.]